MLFTDVITHVVWYIFAYALHSIPMNEEVFAILAFSYFPGIGPTRFDALMAHFSGDVSRAFHAPHKKLAYVIGNALADKFVYEREKTDWHEEHQRLNQAGIHLLSRHHPQFPPLLREIPDPPICIFVKGDISSYDWQHDVCVGVVGTRKPTAYGAHVARMMSRGLAEGGCVVVSGMALGIDGIAHREALRAQKRTIAVLGCGVQVIYPRTHTQLYHDILAQEGLILSEFPPYKTTLTGHFVARNRIISGLSRGVLVVEGRRDSGSLITARYALAQGREVFAPPAPITSVESQAPNILIQEGAHVVTDVKNILDELHLPYRTEGDSCDVISLTPDERQIYEVLAVEPLHLDELVEKTSVSLARISGILSSLELRGVVEKNPIGAYQRSLS